MSGQSPSDREVAALMVAHAAGTATAAERAEAETLAEQDAGAAARLALAHSSRSAIEASEEAAQGQWSPGEMGLRRLLRDIEREEEQKQFAWADSVALWRGVAAAAVLALAVMGALRLGEEGAGRSGYEIATSADARAIAQITFAPTATEAEIRALLLETGGTLVDGPSALGIYRLSFGDAKARDSGVARLKGARIVESVSAE